MAEIDNPGFEQVIPRMIRFPDAVPTLFGDNLHLREPDEADIPAWYARATDAESALLAGDPVPTSVAEGAGWLQRHRERFRQRTGIRWSIVREGAANCVGSIGLVLRPEEPGVAETGFVIAREHWGQGIASAAGRLVTRFAFDELGLTELRAELLQRNAASRRVLEKLGFRFQCLIPDFEQSEAGAEDGELHVLSSRGGR